MRIYDTKAIIELDAFNKPTVVVLYFRTDESDKLKKIRCQMGTHDEARVLWHSIMGNQE